MKDEKTIKYILESLETNEPFLNNDNFTGEILIYDSELNEQKVGDFPNDDSMSIHIEPKEGRNAHFHIMTREKVIMRIRLDTNEYQRDKEEKNGKGKTLNSKQRRALEQYMRTQIPGVPINNWQRLISTWNIFNPSHVVDTNKIQQPNYTTILEP